MSRIEKEITRYNEAIGRITGDTKEEKTEKKNAERDASLLVLGEYFAEDIVDTLKKKTRMNSFKLLTHFAIIHCYL